MSRNYGAKHAMGDVVMFLDDDVVLEPGYNEGILGVYAQGAHVKGVTGFRMDNPKLTLGFRITNAFDRVFFIFGYTEDRCELLPSWYTDSIPTRSRRSSRASGSPDATRAT